MAQEPEQEDKDAGKDKKGKSGWPATLGRALKDNASLIAALLALAGVIITQIVTSYISERNLANQRELEEERAREAEVQTYFDDMGQMLMDEDNPLSKAASNDPISTVAQAKTLTILDRLDAQRKGIVLWFLYTSGVINKDKPVISMARANLRRADLSSADLSATNLSGADLSSASLWNVDLSATNLSDTVLRDASLWRANLRDADLRGTDLVGADLREAILMGADFDNGTWLFYADLRGTDLDAVTGLDQRDVNLTIGDGETRLPEGIVPPEEWSEPAQVQQERLSLSKTL